MLVIGSAVRRSDFWFVFLANCIRKNMFMPCIFCHYISGSLAWKKRTANIGVSNVLSKTDDFQKAVEEHMNVLHLMSMYKYLLYYKGYTNVSTMVCEL